MEKQTEHPRVGRFKLSWVGGLIVVFAIGITAAISFVLYEHTVNLLTDNLRQRLLSIAITQASNISVKDLNELRVEQDWEKPEWSRVVKSLKKAKDTNPNIVFMYIFRKKSEDPTLMEFVADAESINPYVNSDEDTSNDLDANGDGIFDPEGADYLQWPGQDYETPPEEAFLAYEGPLTSSELYEDSYGQVLTGYAPIKDENGNVAAILGTDIKVDDFLIVTRQTLYPFLAYIVVLVLILVALSTAIIRIWNKRVALFAELDRQKDELLSIVSHQLATPVTSVKWYIEMLEGGDLGEINKEQKDHLKIMNSVATNLSDLVSMILDVSRIQLGKMKIEKQELDLDEFFKEILDTIRPKTIEKNITFNEDLPKQLPKANLDKRYTRMTIENLLSNAVKYTPKGGTVDLKVEIRDGILFCRVSDTGCGIPKKDQEKIFGKLFRASNVRNAVDGNGFGLYVAKGAVEAQGGKISFESMENKGTTFRINLPLK